jgi:group I intron endonuclease
MARVNTTCGIYRIKNRVNGKVYIGSSKAIENRVYQHVWELNRNEHHSITLQRAWNKHGKDAFEFETVLICSPDMLLVYEQSLVDFYDSACPGKGYNISKDVTRPPVVEYRSIITGKNWPNVGGL